MHNDNLWAPWRMGYLQQLEADLVESQDQDKSCFLCHAAAVDRDDEEGRKRTLVLARDERGLILLNRYPYINGHLLVAVSEHVGDLVDLSAVQRAGVMELVSVAEHLLRTAYNPQGFNVGINIGRCAGAGLPGHLHVHVVPRWSGDTNFIQILGRVRVIPQAIEESYTYLADVFKRLPKESD